MRRFISVTAAVLFPVFAWAQDVKPVPLADYVSLCLALWERAPDLQSKVSAAGMQNASAGGGASITIGKSTMALYQSAQGRKTVAATFTAFEDGMQSSCDVTLQVAIERAELEAMQRAIGLDGEILTVGPTAIGRWKMRKRHPPVLLKAIVSRSHTTMTMQTFESGPADARTKQGR